MNRIYVFLFRVIIGAVFAVIVMRFFYPQANIVYVAGLGIFLISMAYVTEHFRKRK